MGQEIVGEGGRKCFSCCEFKNNEQNYADENRETESSFNGQAGRKHSILKMKDEWITHSSVGVTQHILKRNTKKIQNFINSLSVPSWCRGISVFQKKSADLLQNAIRDDRAQRTVYRTMRCLGSLGLDPLPTKKQLQVILTLSGGSDLALLWFLMDWLYQDPQSDTYNVNEQLIMSSIAHLDMNTTLQELDRILPPGQPTKRELTRQANKKLSSNCKKHNLFRMEKNLPYFDKLPEPKLRRRDFLIREKERKAIIDCYPSNVIENESRRWFQDYEKDKRDCLMHAAIGNVNENIEKLPIEHKNSIKSVSKSSYESSYESDTDFRSLIQKSSMSDSFYKNHSKTTLLSEKSNADYFKVCQGKLPYEFNYREIFKVLHKNNPDLNCKSAFDCSKQDNNSIQETCCNARTEIVQDKVDYGLDYYDPDDDELMDRLLKDAFDIMKTNPKFVFASIPAAHRFPMLREWIRLRYGKTYCRKALTKSFQDSLPIFEALIKVGLPVDIPSNADLGKNLIMDYSCRDYILRKSKNIRNEYYKRINRALLAQSQVIYFAMYPYLCCNGPPNNTIFAYTPAHKRECYHFRPWKLEECMKHKQVNYAQHWEAGSRRKK